MTSKLTRLIFAITIFSSASFYIAETEAANRMYNPPANNPVIAGVAGVIISIPFARSIDTRKYADWGAEIVIASLAGTLVTSLFAPNNMPICVAGACFFALLVWKFTPALPETLIESARGGHAARVKYLVEQEADIHATDEDGNTALMWSAYHGHLDCVKSLVAQGADIEAKNKKGYTALIFSAYNGHLACLKYLLEQGADINAKNNYAQTPLMFSALNGHLDCVKSLVVQGADIDAKDDAGATALRCSAVSDHKDCIKYLMEQGGDIYVSNEDENTALMESAYEGHLACLRYLQKQRMNKITPLM